MKHMTLLHLATFTLFLQAAAAQQGKDPILVPFVLASSTIIVQATVNGTTGNFILDTGSPALVLNSRYFEGIHIPWKKQAVVDFHGEFSKAKHFVVKELSISEAPVKVGIGLVLDLTSLETTKGIAIYGIIGYTVFSEMEMLLDFEKQHAVIFPIDKKGKRLCGSVHYQLADSLDIKMSGHFPYLIAELEGQRLRLGIDTGAEANILQPRVLKNKIASIELTENLKVRGIKSRRKTCPRGWIRGLRFGHWKQEDQQMVIASMDDLNEYLHVGLDGILGTPFLKGRKVAINYKSKKIYLWEDAVGVMANKDDLKKLEAHTGKH